jgi:DNA-binding SARP family transcriptional activator
MAVVVDRVRAPAGPAWPEGSRSRDVRLDLLTGFELRCFGRPVEVPISAQRVLAFLAVHERPIQRSFVAGTLWSESTEERANGNLRSALWRLNRPGHRLVEGGGVIRLAGDIVVDLRETTRAAHDLLDGTVTSEAFGFGQLRLTGDLLPDWYDEWVLIERERFRQLRLHALETLCRQFAARHRFAQAIEAGLAAVASEPLRESAHRALIQAYLEEGNRAEAIRQYRRCGEVLRQELGIEPSPVTQALAGALTGG